jgi:5,10-methylenetetrahydromethanopterin reductase
MERLGFAFNGAPAVPETMELARLAERNGFESVWVGETRFLRDAIVPAAAIACATQRIQVATGVVNVFTRGPVLTAITFATLDELSGGRAILGIGTGSPLVLAPQGIAFDRPVTRLREYVQVARALLAGERVDYKGRTIGVTGARLDFCPLRRSIPVYLGVTGPKALALAGEIADGMLLNAFLPAAYVPRALGRIAEGARRAGRDPREVDVGQALFVSVDQASEVAKARLRPFIALYLTRFPHIAKESGLPEERWNRIQAAVAAGGLERGAEEVGNDLVDALVVAGTPEECRARINEYREAGVAVPVLFPIEPSLRMALETLGG